MIEDLNLKLDAVKNKLTGNNEPPVKVFSLEDFERYRITDLTAIPEPIPVITWAEALISAPADITAISGHSKTGKTAITQVILAGAVSVDGKIFDPMHPLMVAPNTARKAVIHIDTEQARWKHQTNIKAILKRANLTSCPDNFLSYNIRELPLNEYQEGTEQICRLADERHGGIHMIVIDGIADYVKSVNDEEEAKAIVKAFLDLASRYNMPVITIIHLNPGSDKERGHVGSECQRKAGSVLKVRKDGDFSSLEPTNLMRYTGTGEIPTIQFQYDKSKGYHVSTGTKSSDTTDRDFKKIQDWRALAKRAFPAPGSYPYGEAIERIMKATNQGERTAKARFTDLKVHEYIKQDGNLWRLNIEVVQ